MGNYFGYTGVAENIAESCEGKKDNVVLVIEPAIVDEKVEIIAPKPTPIKACIPVWAQVAYFKTQHKKQETIDEKKL